MSQEFNQRLNLLKQEITTTTQLQRNVLRQELTAELETILEQQFQQL